MECPDTPNSVIAAMLRNDDTALWRKSWTAFFDIYYPVMRAMCTNTIAKIGWSDIDENTKEDIIAKSFSSLMEAFSSGAYIPNKYKFRGFLKSIVARRVIDYVRAQNARKMVSVETIEIIENLLTKNGKIDKSFSVLDETESNIYKRSIIMDIWENIRHSFSPKTCLAFEMAVLEEIPVKEICEKLGVERTHVDKSVHRITKRIKEEISKDFYKRELEK